MRIRNLFCAVIVIAALVVTPATAQSGSSAPTYGVGVSGFGGTTVYVPVHLTSLRLEPQVGFSRRSFTQNQGPDGAFSTLEIGTGVFTTLNSYEATDIYAGGRIGLQRRATTVANTTRSNTGFFLGPAIGGEHYFGDHFSLGAEGALYYRTLSANDFARFNITNFDSGSSISTSVQAFVRFYL